MRVFFLFFFGLSSWTLASDSAVTVKRGGGASKTSTSDLNLTDKERHTSQTFVNEALGNKIVKEECAKLSDPSACQGRGGVKFLGMDSSMFEAVAKGYALIMGSMGMKGGLAGKGGGEAKNDYCALIGAGAEAVGFSMQNLSNKTLEVPTGGETSQKDILYRAVRSHKDRSKTATIQAAGWGGATACYTYMMTMGGASLTSVKNILKLGAAGLLAAFYFSKSGQHKKHAKGVKRIADKLPGKGDCNPVTEPDCYCSFAEYETHPDYDKYCRPYLHKKKVARSSTRVACTDDKLRADPSCKCLQDDNCFEKVLEKDFTISSMGQAFVDSPVGKDISALSRGELKQGGLTSSRVIGQNAALRDFFRRHGDKMPPAPALSPSKEKTALALDKHFGLPAPIGRHILATPMTPTLARAMAKFKGKKKGAKTSFNRGGRTPSRTRYAGGSGLTEKKKASSSGQGGFNFNKFLKRKKKGTTPGKSVLTFQEKALRQVGPSGNYHQGLFDLISKRYLLLKGRGELLSRQP